MKNLLLITAFIALALSACNTKPTMIACVGDSITEGAKHKWQSKTAYPKVLDDLLGPDYSVVNCGRSGTTALKKSNFTYWKCNEFSNVFAVHPDIITIKLGTNDSKPGNWNPQNYKEDYQSLIDTFMSIEPQPKIYLCLPVPVYAHSRMRIDGEIVSQEILPIIRSLAEENQLPLIDLYTPMIGKEALVPDGVHPEAEGAAIIAATIAQEIKE